MVLSFNNGPEELGMVNWIRDYDQALEMSEKLDKPVFILFQEVPGCATCKNYGNNVLSHPFIVEAIEDEFIPLVVYNNKGGADGKVLRKYNEPSWNNPVVRIVDAKGENIVRRLYGNYSQIGVIEKIIEALLNSNKLVPDYLYLFAEELQTKQGLLKESYVSMYCFWTGEKVIGDIQGVAETEAGFMDGKEVVRFKYNPSMVSYDDVLKKAGKAKCADSAYSDDLEEQKIAARITKQKSKSTKAYRADNDVKYYLSNTVYQYLPLSNYQAQKMNVALGKGEVVADYLSPRQKKLLEHINQNRNKKWNVVYLGDFVENWWEVYQKVMS
jgi:peptide methionine sulfoxide reductase MsrA